MRTSYQASDADFRQLHTAITKNEFDKLKHYDPVELTCRICKQPFTQKKGIILKSFKAGFTSGFCSRNCGNKFKINLGTSPDTVTYRRANTNPFRTQYTILSYYGRANLTLFDRYIFTGTLRNDASSRFPL